MVDPVADGDNPADVELHPAEVGNATRVTTSPSAELR
jgi:hypothetical protein